MSDEQKVRGLLALAAELPDDVNPPVQRLLDQGRRIRARRLAAYSALTVIAVAAVVPLLIRGPGAANSRPAVPLPPSGLFPARPQPVPRGPAPAQLSRFRWSDLLPSPIGQRSQPVLAWTGNELIELAGPNGPASAPAGWNDAAAAFSPATGTWHPIAPVPAAMHLTNAFAVWTGRRLFVANANVPSDEKAAVGTSAALYDPATNRWTQTPLPQQLAGATQLAATWTGQVIVAAGAQSGQISAAALNPATGQWTMLLSPAVSARHPAWYISIVATPDRVIVWSFWYRVRPDVNYGVDVLALGREGAWSDATRRWPQEQFVSSPLYTGSAILISPSQIWCGLCSHPGGAYPPGLFADPATLRTAAIPPGPLGYTEAVFAWTGRGILATDLYDNVGGPGALRIRPDDMACYDPATGRWRALPAPPGYPPLAAPPIWAGAQLLELTNSGQLLAFHR
jgi:hypothetical protein